MDILPTNSNISIKSMLYKKETSEIYYVFVVDGSEVFHVGKLHESGGIKGVNYSDELENFIMVMMPLNPNVSKKICSVSWSYSRGEKINFPVALI